MRLSRTLMILEVSRKQEYIFSSKELRENAARSQNIARLTSSAFFRETAPGLYREEENLVYAGGGHTVLQFDSETAARSFAQSVTEAALRQFAELELFVKLLPYDEARTPGENLQDLSQALERKKARRAASFRCLDLGVEELKQETAGPARAKPAEVVPPPEGYVYPGQFEDLTGADNFLAVIHIDGNAMGTRVNKLYKNAEKTSEWDSCRACLQRFSAGIQADFERAFREMTEEVILCLDPGEMLPLRPVILAGDDVCFVTAGSIGLECARIFLEKLTALQNSEDGTPYAACAGVALVHQKYPFHRAYRLAEELCDNAKVLGAELDEERRVSVMDWHIEFGQLKDSLSELRRDYETEDGSYLELRPVVVVAPEETGTRLPPERTYEFFRKLCRSMRGEYGKIARSKIKELRTALKQGEVEGRFFLQDREIGDLLYKPLEAAYSQREWVEKVKNKAAFQPFGEKRRCLFFDAIEMIDHFTALEVEEG